MCVCVCVCVPEILFSFSSGAILACTWQHNASLALSQQLITSIGPTARTEAIETSLWWIEFKLMSALIWGLCLDQVSVTALISRTQVRAFCKDTQCVGHCWASSQRIAEPESLWECFTVLLAPVDL